MKKIKTICFDIDGVIFYISKNYIDPKPIKKNIKIINKLYKKGYIIKLHTARYMGRTNDNKKKAEKKIKNKTIKQLSENGVMYHKIFFGKPSYDLLIDDKSLFFKNDWSKKITQSLI